MFQVDERRGRLSWSLSLCYVAPVMGPDALLVTPGYTRNPPWFICLHAVHHLSRRALIWSSPLIKRQIRQRAGQAEPKRPRTLDGLQCKRRTVSPGSGCQRHADPTAKKLSIDLRHTDSSPILVGSEGMQHRQFGARAAVFPHRSATIDRYSKLKKKKKSQCLRRMKQGRKLGSDATLQVAGIPRTSGTSHELWQFEFSAWFTTAVLSEQTGVLRYNEQARD